ncbi:hypothetical protein SAMN06265171_1041 [Chryseobacterium rhizoplanae]|uniref:Uncharacterized protein n=1 Tax=Chryseobacterium rhizoplanae TaxID=1609531 RepID=A0A521CYP8_9FLAO|nr:hypothetical protein [Chryseobacterium rhizoplanae]SMO64567.1 hypothetical protein SAMN06265171_1041 [Chryseobacterium rhizoplanae]
MKELIYSKIKEYDPQLDDFEISYSNHPLLLDDVIMSYKGRNKLAKSESIKELTYEILNNLLLIKNESVEYVKFVVVRYNITSRLFVFAEDYSKVFFDFTSPTENNSESN